MTWLLRALGQRTKRGANVGVVNPFPVDLDAPGPRSTSRTQPTPMTLSPFCFYSLAWDPCQRVLCLEEDHSHRGKIASLLTAIHLHGYSMTLLNAFIMTQCFHTFVFLETIRKSHTARNMLLLGIDKLRNSVEREF